MVFSFIGYAMKNKNKNYFLCRNVNKKYFYKNIF